MKISQNGIDLIKKYAVTKPLNDMAKRQALLDQLKFNVTAAIANNAADAAADSKDSIDTTSTGTTGRRATATNYKIVTPKTAE